MCGVGFPDDQRSYTGEEGGAEMKNCQKCVFCIDNVFCGIDRHDLPKARFCKNYRNLWWYVWGEVVYFGILIVVVVVALVLFLVWLF
jgi:hypothetical protein